MSVRVETTSRAITAYGGAELLRETARAVGVNAAVEATVSLKHRRRGLKEGQFVLGVAESIALGARCLDDLATARGDVAQVPLRGFAAPAPQTAGSWLRRFTLGHIGQLNKALARCSATPTEPRESMRSPWTSTRPTSSAAARDAKASTAPTSRATRCTRCCASTPTPVPRFMPGCGRGRAGASTGMKTFLTETLRRVPKGVAVRARFDSGFYGGPFLEQMERAGVTYLCGVPLVPAILNACNAVGDACWAPCVDKDEGEVAEFGYRLRDGRRFRRYIVKRIAIDVGDQASLDSGAWRYRWSESP